MILETLLMPQSADDMMRLIATILMVAFGPAWVYYSKHYHQRCRLLDSLNSITTTSIATALLVVPLQNFFDFGGLVSFMICVALTAAMMRYLNSSSPDMYKNMQNNFIIEFPEFSEQKTEGTI